MSRTTSILNKFLAVQALVLSLLAAIPSSAGEIIDVPCSDSDTKAGSFTSLVFSGEWPGKKDIFFHPGKSLHEFASCELKIYWPEDAPKDAQIMAFVKDWDYFWYQNLLDGYLKPGATNTVVIDFTPSARDWEPKGHYGGWHLRATFNPAGQGFSILSKKEYSGRPEVLSARFKLKDKDTSKPGIKNVRINKTSLPCYEKFEVTLDLPDRYPDPFDSGQIHLYAEFVLPDGSEERVDGFYTQNYFRKEDTAETRVSPQGKPYWCIRFSPWKEGKHSFRIIAEDEGGKTQWGPGTFNAEKPVKPGFIRVSRKDPRFFEFDNRDAFFPIGYNIRSPFDTRMDRNFPWKQRWPEGSSAYERHFTKMQESGQNMAEVWFASWSLGLEWNKDWFGYHGVGQYNLIHAFEMDRVVDLAEEKGIYLNLVAHNHGKFSTFSDEEWASNPFNIRNGGWLNDPFLYFSDEKAIKSMLKLMRYKIARWRYSTRVFAWELWSELDLVGSSNYKGVHKRQETIDWHAFIGNSIKEMDPYDHMVSSHVCGSYTHQNPELISLKEMDLCPVDAYHGSQDPIHIVQLLKETANFNNPYKKPVLVTEFGGSPQGGSTTYLETALHSALWSSTCIPVSGTPMFWWWGIIEEENYYPIFRAVSNFMEGEDRRNPDAKSVYPHVRMKETGEPLFSAAVYQSRTDALGWIYYTGSLWDRPLPKAATAEGLSLLVNGLADGNYTVEFWDTRRGKKISTATATASQDKLSIEAPEFTRDIAFKIRRKGEAQRGRRRP